ALSGVLFQAAPGDVLGSLVQARACTWLAAVPERVALPTVVLRPGMIEAERLLRLTDELEPIWRGAALCRAGRHEEAVRLLASRHDPRDRLFLALAEIGRGRKAEAKQLVQKVTEELDDPHYADHLPWDMRLEIDLLRREVEAALRTAKE